MTIAAFEDQVLTDNTVVAELRSQLADQRRRAIALRRFLAPQREAFTKLAVAQIQLPYGSTRSTRSRHGRGPQDRMTRTVEELDAARDRAAITQEELGARIAELTNRRIYTLSIITAIFLPLGFVCTLFSVQIGGVPFREVSWAFWALLGSFVVGSGFQLWFFKRRGWI